MLEKWSELEIAYVLNSKETTDLSWEEITEKYNKKFRKDRNYGSVKKCYHRYKDIFSQEDNHFRTLKKIHTTKKTSSYNAKENRVILEEWIKREDLLESIGNTIKQISLTKQKVAPKKAKSKAKKDMTLEVLASDIHYGKLVDHIEGNFVNNEVIRERVRKMSSSVVKEIERESKSFNVERVILALIGDIIENADFHGQESQKGVEFSTSKQVQESINSLFFDLILPIAKTGIKMDIPCVTGNHDRIGRNKTYHKPGEDNLTYIIYKTLELVCQQSGLKNVKFQITAQLYLDVSVYGNTIVYEHGDELKNINRDTMANQMGKRQDKVV
jgi:hypothetical protein